MGTGFDNFRPEKSDRALSAELTGLVSIKASTGISVGNARLDFTAPRGSEACDYSKYSRYWCHSFVQTPVAVASAGL